MGISGVGSSFSYLYNASTGKLSSMDGSSDDFADYFNGELLDEDQSDTLNGFDVKKKDDIESMIRLFRSGINGSGLFTESDGKTLYEISGSIVDAATAEYKVDGRKIFESYQAVPYTKAQQDIFAGLSAPEFATRVSKGYDPADNSINIAVGDVFDLGDGYRLIVKDSYVQGVYGKGNVTDHESMNGMVQGLNSLIHFADQQWMSNSIFSELTPMLLDFLNELGVDTDKEFIINGTKCEVVNGRIKEVGNKGAIPTAIYHEALKLMEEDMSKPLSQRKNRVYGEGTIQVCQG